MLTVEQIRTIARMRSKNSAWQHIADDPATGDAILTIPFPDGYLDAIVGQNGALVTIVRIHD